jgi:hypothetical protein
VSRREAGDVTRTKFLLAAVVHDNMETARNVILQVGSLAALSVHQRNVVPSSNFLLACPVWVVLLSNAAMIETGSGPV